MEKAFKNSNSRIDGTNKLNAYVGTSGWHFKDWTRRFYPEKMRANDWLKFYSQYFDTVEVNSAYYRLISKSTYEKWRDDTGINFIFSVKLNRFITHVKKLIIDDESLIRLKIFLKNVSSLGNKLGPILVQLPPSFKFNPLRLELFFKKIIEEAKKNKVNLMLCVEFRNASWLNNETFDLMRQYGVGYCISDSSQWPTEVIRTVDWAYLRLHGRPSLFVSLYTVSQLEKWQERLKQLGANKVFVYFNNDTAGRAVKNAQMLKNIIEKR